ncbi:unnamed protein product [Withania somnifera]
MITLITKGNYLLVLSLVGISIDAPEGTTVETDKVLSVIQSLKKESASKRADYIKKRAEENAEKLYDATKNLFKLSTERRNLIGHGAYISTDLLSKRKQDAIGKQNGIAPSNGDNDSYSFEDDGYASSEILLGSSIVLWNAVCSIKLPEVERLPRFMTWIFLDRNQRMTEDQSVVGRRRIYYDQNTGEALNCSDSDGDFLEDKEEKREFVESEDVILRSAIQQVGLSDRVLELLGQCLSRKPSEVKGRYEDLVKDKSACSSKNENIQGTPNLFLDSDLDAALDSFDSLFCRRCLVFDCKSHGCSQDLIFTAEKQLPWNSPDVDEEPCCQNCYLLNKSKAGWTSSQIANHGENPVRSSEIANNTEVPGRKHLSRRSKTCQTESVSSNAKNIPRSSDSETMLLSNTITVQRSASAPNRKSDSKGWNYNTNCKRVAENVLVATIKQQVKMTAVESDYAASGSLVSKDLNLHSNSHKGVKDVSSSSQKIQQSHSCRRSREDSPVLGSKHILQGEGFSFQYKEATSEKHGMNDDYTLRKNEFMDDNNGKQEIDGDKPWRPLEKALFEKGLEMFGLSSCMIARNLLNGLKNCWEVFQYMNKPENKLSRVSDEVNGMFEGSFKDDGHTIMGNQPRRRSRFLRRRGRARHLKYTSKSAGYHALRKRISVRKDQLYPQYSPCNCQAPCGKECPCFVNGTCCEKYCGCPKNCKTRFRGCFCAGGQCGTMNCACFASGRECDPDKCPGCWISCGDGTLDIPAQRGENNECGNMKLLLKQHQRVLLGRSDVSGWGAFLKNSVEKDEYLGEYTGEIVSHHEADKRGKIYDLENSSYLFNLNDQSVLDAYRKGDKLKFANHSPDPNCYAKVIMTAGDHRVGIFAKEKICAGEELFYDYCYGPDTTFAWAKKPEAPTTRNVVRDNQCLAKVELL